MKKEATAAQAAAAFLLYLVQFGQPALAGESAPPGPNPITREVKYAPINGSDRTISSAELAMEIASEFPAASGYGQFRVVEEKRDSSGVYGQIKTGVLARADNTKVHLEWASVDQTIGGSQAASTTKCDLIVETKNGAPGVFTITATSLTEQIGHDPIVFFKKRPLLDALDRIQADLTATLQKLPLEFPQPIYGKEELDVSYPPASVFANFERRLGKPKEEKDVGGDTRAGTFPAGDRDDLTRSVKVKVYPFHAGSKVEIAYSATYKLKPDGSSTVDSVKPFVEKLRAIAQE